MWIKTVYTVWKMSWKWCIIFRPRNIPIPRGPKAIWCWFLAESCPFRLVNTTMYQFLQKEKSEKKVYYLCTLKGTNVNRSPNPTVGSGTSARCLPRCSTGRTDVISYVRSVVLIVLHGIVESECTCKEFRGCSMHLWHNLLNVLNSLVFWADQYRVVKKRI